MPPQPLVKPASATPPSPRNEKTICTVSGTGRTRMTSYSARGQVLEGAGDGRSSEGWGLWRTCWPLRARRTKGKRGAGVGSDWWWFADAENSALLCPNWEMTQLCLLLSLYHVVGTEWSSYPGDLWHLTRSVSTAEWTVSSKCCCKLPSNDCVHVRVCGSWCLDCRWLFHSWIGAWISLKLPLIKLSV